jgi:xylulokinase
MTHLLGIDIGTSSVKAALFDVRSARIAAVAGHEYPIHKPAPDRAEQDPDDWWRATVIVVRRILAEVENPEVLGISFSGQMHGTVLVDRAGKPLHPAIIWADQRTAETPQQLIDAVGAERYVSIAGTLPAAGFMGATLVWLAAHEPVLLERAYKVVLPKDYVRLRMTGETATEVTDAASSGIFDVNARRWADEIISRVGIPKSILPDVLASSEVAGHLTAAASAELGLKAGIPVIAGCGDQPAQAIGNGLIAPGMASVNTGSGGQVCVPLALMSGGVRGDQRVHVFNHAVPDMWYVLGAILSAGLSLRWLRNLTGLEGNPEAYPILSAEAARVPPGADGLIFQPYLSGERTPHMDGLARGTFIGLSYHHGRGHLAKAIMEGVAFALRQALEISLSLGGTIERVIVAGGGAESDVWRQIQADVFGLSLRQTMLTEQASVGAALLAGVGTGVYPDFKQACQQTVRYGSVTEPDAKRHELYDGLYDQFVELYPRLRDDFHKLSLLAHRVPG